MRTLVAIFIVSFLFIINSSYAAKRHTPTLCENPEYTCHTVKRGNTWEKLFPNPEQRDLVMRINRMNIQLQPGMKIAIPNSTDFDPLKYSPLATLIDPPGKKTIIVSISKLAFGAYESDGTLKYWGPISAARGYCPDIGRSCNTSLGKFTIYQKGGPGCASTRYPVGRGGAPMPYCMFFNGNFALHGSYEVPGYNASHGCVRLFVKDAKWLNQEFSQGSTTVIVNK